MSADDPSGAPIEAAVTFYGRALEQLETLWAGDFQRSRPRSRRVALRITELSREHSDLLLGLTVTRGDHGSIAEHVLQLALVTSALARQAEIDDRHCYELALYALLHHLGHDTRGALTTDPGFLAQRSLLSLLLSQVPERLHYRQSLTAFQLELGADNAGEPHLELAVQQHPLTAFLTLAHDLVELVCGSPFDAHTTRSHIHEALDALEQRPQRHPAALLSALRALFTPAHVGAFVELSDGRRAVVARAHVRGGPWRLEVLTLDGSPVRMTLTPQSLIRVHRYLASPACTERSPSL